MKLLLVATLLVALAGVGYASSIDVHTRQRRAIFGDVDPNKVPAMLNNPAFIDAQHRCIMASQADAARLCDRIGKKLREYLGPAIQKADCPVECTQREREVIVEVIDTIQTKHPKIWADIETLYGITPDKRTNVKAWVDKVKASKTA